MSAYYGAESLSVAGADWSAVADARASIGWYARDGAGSPSAGAIDAAVRRIDEYELGRRLIETRIFARVAELSSRADWRITDCMAKVDGGGVQILRKGADADLDRVLSDLAASDETLRADLVRILKAGVR